MTLKQELINYEETTNGESLFIKVGEVPIIITAPHTTSQKRSDGSIKKAEPFTKAICMLVTTRKNCSCLIKLEDTGIDANSLVDEEFKRKLLSLIKKNNIKLAIDLHGAKGDRDFDIELGTLDNKSIKKSLVQKLEQSFYNNGIKKIVYNNPFKGGGITQYVYNKIGIDVVQIEINSSFRNLENIDKISAVCNALMDFIDSLNK